MSGTHEDGLMRVSIEVWLIESNREKQHGLLQVLTADTDEPIRNDPHVCAAIAAVLNEIIYPLLPMPSQARIEFRAFGNRVRFCSDKEPSEDVLIDMALNLLRQTIA